MRSVGLYPVVSLERHKKLREPCRRPHLPSVTRPLPGLWPRRTRSPEPRSSTFMLIVNPKRTASPDPERGKGMLVLGSVNTQPAGRGCNSSPCGSRSLRTSTHTRSSQIHDSAQGPSRADSPAEEEAGEMRQRYSRQVLAQGTVPLFVRWHSRSWHALALSRPLSAVSAPRAANTLAWCTPRLSAYTDQMRLQPVVHLDGEQG